MKFATSEIWIKFILIAAAALALIAAGLAFGWQLAAAAFLALAGWGAAWFFRAALAKQSRRSQEDRAKAASALDRSLAGLREAEQRLTEQEELAAENKLRLETLLRLNRALVEAHDEQALMDTALSALTDLVGALGCSFVPVDEWQQPLPAFTHGQLPEPVLRAWAAHLTSGMLRHRCGNCQVLESTPGACPLHPEQVGGALNVYCLPLVRTAPAWTTNGKPADAPARAPDGTPVAAPVVSPGIKLGVLHLYLPAGRELDAGTRQFLDGLLQEIALAYENARLRAQEIATLRQIQMLHASASDFTASLYGLLDGIKQALETDFVLLRLRPSPDERLSNLDLRCGEPRLFAEGDLEALFDRVTAGEQAASPPGQLPAWLALPLALPDGAQGLILGMLLAGSDHPQEFHPRQRAILQTVAAQAALLVENERLIRSLEYKVIIQERARLAREIHDGLAQTLAFLKLQSAQMQSYLAQGDTARLAQVLKDNYQALAEAYLDTRQAIDNLRLTPQDGIETWLERILREFENTSGLRVTRDFDINAQTRSHSISPEVQAQLIRVVQEALSNVRKHARARQVWVSLRLWQGDLLLEVTDDGLGFDADDMPEISQHGLRGMRERAEMIGADFQIVSQERQGTTVRLVLPPSVEEEISR